MPCSCCQSANGRSNTCSCSFRMRSELRQAVAPFHQGRGDQADDEGDDRAHGRHDQNRDDRAGNAASLEKARGRRQHGADHEGRHDREKERLGGVEHGDDADDEQRDQREGDDFGAPDHRRQFGSGCRAGACRASLEGARSLGRTRNWLSPLLAADWADESGFVQRRRRTTKRAQAGTTGGACKRFHRGNVSDGRLDMAPPSHRVGRNRGAPVAFVLAEASAGCASHRGRS